MKRLVIIGGGISGLALAHRLTELSEGEKAPLQVTLLEAQGRLGGVIGTKRQEGFLLEGGPDSFLSEKPWAYELCKRIGLEEEIIGTQSQFRRSFIFHRGKLTPLPNGFYLIAPLHLRALAGTSVLSLKGKLRVASEPFISPRKEAGDESLASFIRRRLGEEALRRIGQPMIGGIYSGDPEALSVQATFPLFHDLEREYGSVIRGLRAARGSRNGAMEKASGPRYSLFLSLRGGIERLVERLIERMPEVDFRLSSSVESVEPGERWRIEIQGKPPLEADALCLALPSYAAARLVHPFAGELAGDLEAIPYESVATVNLAFQKEDLPRGQEGFGFVVPASEGKSFLGSTFSHLKYPGRAPENSVLIRAFVGGAFGREVVEWNDERLGLKVLEELREILGIKGRPLFVSIRRYPRSMPQYRVGHLERVSSIEKEAKRFPGLFLTGNAYRGIGIPDCIRQAQERAREIFSYLRGRSDVL